MQTIPSLAEIIQRIEKLALARRKKAPQGRKPIYSDSTIIGLAVYQKLAKIKHAQAMLVLLASLAEEVPAASTFSERKSGLVGQIILAVKQLCAKQQATAVRQHLDSKKLAVIDIARAKRTKLAGAYGYDHIHKSYFYGFRLHALVDDQGKFCHVLLRPANEHDVAIAPRLLNHLEYTIITADKGYISQDFKLALDKHAVHLVTPRRSNQLPPPKAEKKLYKHHRIVETAFSSLDNLGFSDRPYRSTLGLVLHVYITILTYQLRDILSQSVTHVSFFVDELHIRLLYDSVYRIGVTSITLHIATSTLNAYRITCLTSRMTRNVH
jgi:hypothetical protein